MAKLLAYEQVQIETLAIAEQWQKLEEYEAIQQCKAASVTQAPNAKTQPMVARRRQSIYMIRQFEITPGC